MYYQPTSVEEVREVGIHEYYLSCPACRHSPDSGRGWAWGFLLAWLGKCKALLPALPSFKSAQQPVVMFYAHSKPIQQYARGSHVCTPPSATSAINVMHTHLCTYLCMLVHMQMHEHTRLQTYGRAHPRTHPCTYACTHLYAHTPMHRCTYSPEFTDTCANIHLCTYRHLSLCAFAHIGLCTHIYIQTCAHLRACMNIYAYI